MIASRKTTREWHNASTERVTVKLTSLPCRADSVEAGEVFVAFMRAILDDSVSLQTGGWYPFNNATISHHDGTWVMQAVSYVKREGF